MAMEFVDILPYLVALLIGALIGTERQRRIAEEKIRGVAGLRTFTLIALLGALTAELASKYGQNFAIVALGGMIILIAYSYSASVSVLGRLDFTGAAAAVITFLLGMLASFDDTMLLAVALSIITTWILATRTITHRYVEALNETDLLDTLKMGIIALVIYPLLPNEPIGPFQVINLRVIWTFVVLVSLIGYSGYILIRILGTERGLGITGVLGGLVSSTAVTTSMAAEVKENKEIISSAVFATVIASCIMFPRILFIVFFANQELLLPLLPQLTIMAVVGVILAFQFLRRSEPAGKNVQVKDPFRILPALKLAAFFALVLLTAKLAVTYFGTSGVYAASIIAGLADVDAISYSMATLAKTTINPNTAANAITLAAMTNMLVKLFIAFALGTMEFGKKVAIIFVPMIMAGLFAVIIL
ncbi:MAG: MgtC/SapB family protein [Methanotrichaceae archaeon]|nr:MgtC/SapB family protein [Methanotrichaceae archaeon]